MGTIAKDYAAVKGYPFVKEWGLPDALSIEGWQFRFIVFVGGAPLLIHSDIVPSPPSTSRMEVNIPDKRWRLVLYTENLPEGDYFYSMDMKPDGDEWRQCLTGEFRVTNAGGQL